MSSPLISQVIVWLSPLDKPSFRQPCIMWMLKKRYVMGHWPLGPVTFVFMSGVCISDILHAIGKCLNQANRYRRNHTIPILYCDNSFMELKIDLTYISIDPKRSKELWLVVCIYCWVSFMRLVMHRWWTVGIRIGIYLLHWQERPSHIAQGKVVRRLTFMLWTYL